MLLIVGLIVLGVVFFVIIPIAYKSLYKKVPPDSALVVSGGKETKAYFGGKMVNPLTCRTQEISLNTMNLKIERKGAEALITKDSLRVDIEAEFFVKIQKEEQDVLAAAASLGEKTQTPESVKDLLEGKLVGALRAVAATMELQQLHEQRQEFQDAVEKACSEDLKQNGFTLETVSITGLDQTPLEQLDENNQFDAVAIRTINEKVLLEKQATEKNKVETDIVLKEEEERGKMEMEKLKVEAELKIQEEQTRKEKEAARLEAEALIVVEKERIEAEMQKLKLERDLAFAKAEQEQAVQEAEIKKAQAVEEAEIKQKQAIDLARIQQEREVQEAEIQQKQVIEKAKIDQIRAIEEAKIEQEKAIKAAEAESAIAIAMKVKESELAETDKLQASAEKTKAEAQVLTVEATEEAEREAKIKLIEAEQKAEAEYISKQKVTEAEAYMITKTAEAELEAAKLKAESMRLLAEAELEELKAKAEGEKAMIEAKNTADEKILVQEPIMALVEQLPEIAERLMKPAEKIESIRVLDMGGMAARAGGGGGTVGKIASAIMSAGAVVPVMKEFLNFSGVDANELIQKAVDYVPGLNKITKAKAESVPQKMGVEADMQKTPAE